MEVNTGAVAAILTLQATSSPEERALLQRHLWVVFDATIPNDYLPKPHSDLRKAIAVA
jgi:hypothetical protein